MIKVDRCKNIPISLKEELAEGGQFNRAIDYFNAYFQNIENASEESQVHRNSEIEVQEEDNVQENKFKGFNFKKYNQEDVKEKLNEMFYHKCAYCESTYEHLHPMDVEHFRPKGNVQQYRGDNRWTSGYYWLAWDWDNLFPSCIHCNRVAYHKTYDKGKVLRGKGNLFPLEDDNNRAIRHTDLINGEVPQLLNPCEDNPENHIEYTEEGVIRPTLIGGDEDMKGKTSIEVYGLDRLTLTNQREKVDNRINFQIERVKTAIDNTIRYPNDIHFEEQLQFEMEQLKNYMLPQSEYSQMAKQIIGEFLTEIGIDPSL
jgi:uncharacterized protein (TIGR02646 family)